MKTNKAKEIIENALDSLVESLEKGQSEVLKNYLETMSRFHNYSLRNIILIAKQRPQAIRVAGFHTWKKVDRHIIKGEKGIKIVAPIIYKKDSSDDTEEHNKNIRGFRIVNVFDISQTDGEELPELSDVEGDPKEYSSKLNKLISKLKIQLEYSDEIPANGISIGGKIIIKNGLT